MQIKAKSDLRRRESCGEWGERHKFALPENSDLQPKSHENLRSWSESTQ